MSELHQQFTGLLGDLEQRVRALLNERRIVESGTIRVAQSGPGGTQLEVKEPAGAAASGPQIVSAPVLQEGMDALLCLIGDAEVVVMKPEPLRLSWMVRAAFVLNQISEVTQVTDPDAWQDFGYVINYRNRNLSPLVLDEWQVVWPPWVDNVGGSPELNVPRTPHFGESTPSRAVELICARVSKTVWVDSATLRQLEFGEEPEGELLNVAWVDITPGRVWVPLDVARQKQQVYLAGEPNGVVDNYPDNSDESV